MSSEPVVTYPKRVDHVAFRQIGEDTVLVDTQGQELHRLNETAALIWEHCSGERTSDEILDAVRAQFTVDRAEARAQLDDFLRSLLNKGLISLSTKSD